MIRQQFYVEHYWKVVVYYNVDYRFFNLLADEMRNVGASDMTIKKIWGEMSGRKAKAVTYSHLLKRVSIVLFNKHSSKTDYLNSLVHEAEHIKQSMLEAYGIDDSGEPPAYTIGFLVGQMYQVFNTLL